MAASICTRGGKTIVTRQFRDLPKDRITGLLASFPKLTSSGTQHTTAEDDDVRYVYQPIEELYLVLITNLQSNILQDIDTLHLLAQVVSSIVRQADEREILANCFEILSAFDEVIALGYRENLTLLQVKTFLEMESHEEKIYEIIERNKELEAAEERKLRAKQLEINRKEMAKRPGGANPYSNHGVSSMPSLGRTGGSSFGSASSAANPVSEPTYDFEDKPKARSTPMRGKGLQLGKKKAGALHALKGSLGDEAETSLLMETPPPSSARPHTSSQQPSRPAAAASDFDNDGIHIAIKEEISAVVERMGSVKSSEVKGSLQLRIADPDLTNIQILVQANGASGSYRTHPNVDKAAFLKERVIKLKDSRRSFPANNQQLSVLRWQLNGKADDDTLVPLEFHCWFVAGDDGSSINAIVEYELKANFEETLENVVVKIPLPTNDIAVSSTEQAYQQYEDGLEWVIPEIAAGTDSASGSFEWTTADASEDDFFPMAVEFTVHAPLASLGQVEVLDVVSAADESQSIPFKKDIILSSESFAIV